MVPLIDGVPFPGQSPSVEGSALDPPSRAERTASSPEFERLVKGVSSALDRGEAFVQAADRAAYAPMDAGTLIALQAGIYRYTEAVELTAKIVDRATNAVRTVLQSGH